MKKPDIKFEFNHVFTHGSDHFNKRQKIREAAREKIHNLDELRRKKSCWAFRITVRGRGFDIENTPKLIVDSFSNLDSNKIPEKKRIVLFKDDDISNVRKIEVIGKPSDKKHTLVEIFRFEDKFPP